MTVWKVFFSNLDKNNKEKYESVSKYINYCGSTRQESKRQYYTKVNGYPIRWLLKTPCSHKCGTFSKYLDQNHSVSISKSTLLFMIINIIKGEKAFELASDKSTILGSVH